MIRRILALMFVSALTAAIFLNPLTFGLVVGNETEPHRVSVEAQELQLVCPGPVFKSLRSNVSNFAQEGAASLAVTRTLNNLDHANLKVFGTPGAQELPANSVTPIKREVSLSASSTDANVAGSELISAAQLQRVSTDWASGLSGTSCQRPSGDLWLVGGDTTTGREALLILVNPTNVDATVEISILTQSGYLKAPGLSGVSVPKRQSTIIPINGVAPATSAFAVRVEARGGLVGGWLQQRAVRGTKPGGIDLISPVTAEAKEQTIPGFFVRGTKDADGLISASGAPGAYRDLRNIVRIANPGDQDAKVLVRVIGANNQTFGTVVQQTIPAASVADLEISGITDGDFAIFVSSDQPILASAKLNRTGLTNTPVSDFTWLSSLMGSSGKQRMVVPEQGISKLALANPAKSAISVTLRNGSSNLVLQLAAGSTRTITLAPGSVELQSDKSVMATVIVDIGGSVANFPMVEYRNIGGVVSVFVQ